jgi:hypothetical protein
MVNSVLKVLQIFGHNHTCPFVFRECMIFFNSLIVDGLLQIFGYLFSLACSINGM